MKALKRFDPYRGVRLASFAVYWIRAEIHEFIFKNWKIVKVATTKAQRKLFFKIRSLNKEYRQKSISNDKATAIANELDVDTKEVVNMANEFTNTDISIDYSLYNTGRTLSNTIASSDGDPYQVFEKTSNKKNIKNLLNKGLAKLDNRSKDIFTSRHLKNKKETLNSLSVKYGVSIERIRQLENKAIKVIRDEMSVFSI